MPKNKFNDLNDHLFAQLERLGEEDLDKDKLKLEIERAKAVASIATNIVEAAKAKVQAMRLCGIGDIQEVPELMQDKKRLEAV